MEVDPEYIDIGDMVGITANSAHVVAKWGNGSVHHELQDIICVMDSLQIYNYKGEHLTTQNMPGFSAGAGYMGKRNDILTILCNHALSLGIEIIRGKRITDYFETDTEAGVVVDGERVVADCVLACDGVNSKARGFVTGAVGAPHPTGYATFRAWFDGSALKDDPQASWLTEGDQDRSIAFIGPDVHCIFGTGKRCKEVVWVLTHLVLSQNANLGFCRHRRILDPSWSSGRRTQSGRRVGPESWGYYRKDSGKPDHRS